MTTETFDFLGSKGHYLSGRLERPETITRGWAVLAHCFTCGKDSVAATRLARALALNGIGVLRFDFAGLGSSSGIFAETTFAADVEDMLAAGRAMAADDKEPGLLVGHSLGGAAALMAAREMPGLRAVATIGAPFDVAHVLHQFDSVSLEMIETAGEAEVLLGGRPYVVRKSGSFEFGVGNAAHEACELKAEKSSFPAMRKRTVRMVSKRAYPRALRLAA
jgi:pimeloyl-ACP methyl ester carboxylesterase